MELTNSAKSPAAKIFLNCFILVVLLQLLSISLELDRLRSISKGLLIPLLMLYFYYATTTSTTSLKKWVLLALFFSWGGDVLLLFEPRDPNFFILGLISFLIAHIFYILFFRQLKILESVKSRVALLLIVIIYYASLIFLLFPFLGNMKIPVLVYGIVISTMFLLAMHMQFIRDRRAGLLMLLGSLAFVLSDSMLAINKFYTTFTGANLLVMLSYSLAQLFIVLGAARYLTKN